MQICWKHTRNVRGVLTRYLTACYVRRQIDLPVLPPRRALPFLLSHSLSFFTVVFLWFAVVPAWALRSPTCPRNFIVATWIISDGGEFRGVCALMERFLRKISVKGSYYEMGYLLSRDFSMFVRYTSFLVRRIRLWGYARKIWSDACV